MNLALAVLVKLKILRNSLIHDEIKVQKVFQYKPNQEKVRYSYSCYSSKYNR